MGFGIEGVLVTLEVKGGEIAPPIILQVTTNEHGQAYVTLTKETTYRITAEYLGNTNEKTLAYNGEPVLMILIEPETKRIVDIVFLTPQPASQQNPVTLLLTNSMLQISVALFTILAFVAGFAIGRKTR